QRYMNDSTASSHKKNIQVETLYGFKETFTESNLEKVFVKELEYIGYIKRIVHQPITINLTNSTRKYTPDFFIQTYDNQLLLVEIKDFKEIITDGVRKKHNSLVTYFKDYPIQIKLITRYKDQWYSLEDILD